MGRPQEESSTAPRFDVIVIGAGINGGGIARDAAMRGLKVLLIDKSDLSSGTSAYSTRLIHGGLRYLEHAEFALVRESLRERETLLTIAPHLVRPIRMLIPVYRHSRRGLWKIRAGMGAYDLLSLGKSLERHRMLSREEVISRVPGIEQEGLLGGALYSDCQVEYAERLVVENALSARDHGAVVKTYCRVDRIETEDQQVRGIEYTDVLSGERASAAARSVVNAAGPWVDSVLSEANGGERKRIVCGTKGSHIVVGRLPGASSNALYVEARADGRPFFIIPWNGLYLIGTTDMYYAGDLDQVQATDEEIEYLIAEANRVIPSAELTPDKVLYTYSGVRPLPCVETEGESRITRRHIIHDHSKDRENGRPVKGLISIIGGKLTTYRSLSQQAVDLIFNMLQRTTPPCRTAVEPLPGAASGSFPEFRDRFNKDMQFSDKTKDHLLRVYGVRAARVVEMVKEDERLGEVIDQDSGAIAAEVLFATRDELARTAADVIDRRTMIGLGGSKGREVAQRVEATLIESSH